MRRSVVGCCHLSHFNVQHSCRDPVWDGSPPFVPPLVMDRLMWNLLKFMNCSAL